MLKFKLNFGEKDKIASSLEQSELAKQAQIEPPQKGERLIQGIKILVLFLINNIELSASEIKI